MSHPSTPRPRPTKLCFVTVGATASFNALVQEILSVPFLEALRASQYTDLMIQYGQQGEALFREFQETHGAAVQQQYGLYVTGFDFNLNGLKQEMMAVKANPAS